MNASPTNTLLGHPSGLFLLFGTEMWERFCYYGMRALVVLTLVAATDAANPGFGMDRGQALALYGWYTSSAYATNILGGWLADHVLGNRRAVLLGGLLMTTAQFILFWAVPDSLTLYYLGLVTMAAGVGLFKPNISTMVGQLYSPGDARRDGAFSIFYMGINLGAFIAPFVCSTLAENPDYGWRWGYFAAGLGMLIALLLQALFAQRTLGEIGLVPAAQLHRKHHGSTRTPLTLEERDRLRVIFTLFIFVTLFWTAFEQAGGLLNLVAQDNTQRQIGNFEVPAGWFQSANPLFIIVLAPLFAWLWVRLARSGLNPPASVKIALGMVFTALGFACLVLGVFDMQDKTDHKASMVWLLLGYLFHTLGELCISPVGLSLMTKLAPLRLLSVTMGIWFLMPACAYLGAGYLGAFTEGIGGHTWAREFANSMAVAPEHAGLLVVFSAITILLILFAMVLSLLSGTLVAWMHGAESNGASSPKPDFSPATGL